MKNIDDLEDLGIMDSAEQLDLHSYNILNGPKTMDEIAPSKIEEEDQEKNEISTNSPINTKVSERNTLKKEAMDSSSIESPTIN